LHTTIWLGLIALLLGLPFNAPAWAWGADGHRIVCAIAWDEMRPAIRHQVERVLGEKGRNAFAESCNWADEMRPSRPETAPHHYVHVPRGAAGVDITRDCPLGR